MKEQAGKVAQILYFPLIMRTLSAKRCDGSRRVAVVFFLKPQVVEEYPGAGGCLFAVRKLFQDAPVAVGDRRFDV